MDLENTILEQLEKIGEKIDKNELHSVVEIWDILLINYKKSLKEYNNISSVLGYGNSSNELKNASKMLKSSHINLEKFELTIKEMVYPGHLYNTYKGFEFWEEIQYILLTCKNDPGCGCGCDSDSDCVPND